MPGSFAANTTMAGIDGISHQMLNHLPDSWKHLLHAFLPNVLI